MTERAGRWIRVSTGGQDEANQELDIDAWIDGHGYELGPCGPERDGTYRVHAKSAYTGKHEKMLDQLITDMQDKKLSVLVVWQSSRIERRGVESTWELVSRVRRAGGRIEFAAPGDQYLNDANDMSDVQLSLAAWKDHKESKDKSERVTLAKNRIRKNGALDGRACYGYRIDPDVPKYSAGLMIYEPEAKILREAVDRYLCRNGYQGESLDNIAEDFNRRKIPSPMWRGKPGKCWYGRTLGQLFRNPTIAGRRMNGWGKDERDRKTVYECPAVITWEDHVALNARLDSRATRKGISPANASLLTGMLTDDSGHMMYAETIRGYRYYRCRTPGCGIRIRQEGADAFITATVLHMFGAYPHMRRDLKPGRNHSDTIARLRQDRSELNDMADDYTARHAELTAEIRRLVTLDREHPEPDRVEWVFSGKSIAEHWQSLDIPARRDWLKEAGWKVTAAKLEDGRARLTLDFGGDSAERAAASLGFPIEELEAKR